MQDRQGQESRSTLVPRGRRCRDPLRCRQPQQQRRRRAGLPDAAHQRQYAHSGLPHRGNSICAVPGYNCIRARLLHAPRSPRRSGGDFRSRTPPGPTARARGPPHRWTAITVCRAATAPSPEPAGGSALQSRPRPRSDRTQQLFQARDHRSGGTGRAAPTSPPGSCMTGDRRQSGCARAPSGLQPSCGWSPVFDDPSAGTNPHLNDEGGIRQH
jgi:hypothetical protein